MDIKTDIFRIEIGYTTEEAERKISYYYNTYDIINILVNCRYWGVNVTATYTIIYKELCNVK